MIDLRSSPPAHHHRAVSPAALREATGQANSFEMTPIRRQAKEEEEEHKEEAASGKNAVEAAAVVVVAAPPPPSSSSSSSSGFAAPIEQRRLEAQRHRHAEVWTKDPHGGKHRPAGPSAKGLDPLTHDAASGAPLPPPPPGFEKPVRPGPTTNFVGDAMLGTATGLIAARLSAADARAAASASSAALLRSSSSSSSPSAKPLLPLAAPAKKVLLLLEGEEEKKTPAGAAPVPPVEIERYGFDRAREVAALLLGRRLPRAAEAGELLRRGGGQQEQQQQQRGVESD